jgi:hypothetical protein
VEKLPLCTALPLLVCLHLPAQELSLQDPKGATLEQRLQNLEARLQERDTELDELRAALNVEPSGQKAWYEKLRFRGYGQFRYTSLFDDDNSPDLYVPADKSASEAETFVLRRGRVVLQGDVSKRVAIYVQMDFAAGTGAPDYSLQMRDYYADIAFDDRGEFRIRPGVSKVPFGWVNMQSSSNRAPFERPDGINSAVEGERDFGAFFYWAPREIRDRFRELTATGLKGSGDYGVFGFGPYSGQGLNRSDKNGELHWVMRLNYPFKLDSGQFVELGVMGYHGRFVPKTSAIDLTNSGTSADPLYSNPDGVRDERVGVTAVWYPQPIGLEAEWNWGRGPTLSDDGSSITSESLHGGYIQAAYRHFEDGKTFYPFVRWNYFDGGRKFGTNAPQAHVNEVDVGFEFSPERAVEVTLAFSHTFRRTNTRTAPYDDVQDEQRLGIQVQMNF